MIGLPDPEHRHVGKRPGALAQLVVKEEVDHRLLRVKIGKDERNAARVILQETLALDGGLGGLELVNAGVEVPFIARGVHVLQPRAPHRVRAQDAQPAAVGGEQLAHVLHRVEPFGLRGVLGRHALKVPAREDRGSAAGVRVEEAVGDDAVAAGSEARENHRVVDVGFRRKTRKVVLPAVRLLAKACEIGHHLVGDVAGTQAVKAHEQNLVGFHRVLVSHVRCARSV